MWSYNFFLIINKFINKGTGNYRQETKILTCSRANILQKIDRAESIKTKQSREANQTAHILANCGLITIHKRSTPVNKLISHTIPVKINKEAIWSCYILILGHMDEFYYFFL